MSRSECLWSGGIFFKYVYCLEKTLKHLLFQKNKYKNKLYGERMPPCFITCIFLLEVFTIRY